MELAFVLPVIGILVGYGLGALPVGFIVCRLFGVDIRRVGSGRTGATNAWRAAGLKAALPTLLGDALKGAVAVGIMQIVMQIVLRAPADGSAPWWRILTPSNSMMIADFTVMKADGSAPWWRILTLSLTGGMAVIGHNWSVFLRFKGGAGGITCAVTSLALYWPVGLMAALVGAAMMYWSRIAAIGTLSVAVTTLAGFLAMVLVRQISWLYLAFPVLAVTAVALSLRPNREKLRQGAERVVTLW